MVQRVFKKHTIAICVLISLIVLQTRCNESDPAPALCHPRQIGPYTFIYNEKNQVILDDWMSYTYDDKGNITSSFNGDVFYYTYDQHNNLIRKEYSDGEADIYEYNTSGQLITALERFTLGLRTYEYPNSTTKNPSKVTGVGCCNMMDVYEYEYDDKRNPLWVLFPSLRTDNNVIKNTYSVSVPLPAPMTGVAITTYEYNAQGYPVSVDGDGGSTRDFRISGNYTIAYDCK